MKADSRNLGATNNHFPGGNVGGEFEAAGPAHFEGQLAVSCGVVQQPRLSLPPPASYCGPPRKSVSLAISRIVPSDSWLMGVAAISGAPLIFKTTVEEILSGAIGGT